MAVLEETIDIAVIGAGHAGCEAALAAARMGLETVVFTVSVDSIAMMPCNPNIGALVNSQYIFFAGKNSEFFLKSDELLQCAGDQQTVTTIFAGR